MLFSELQAGLEVFFLLAPRLHTLRWKLVVGVFSVLMCF